MGVSWDQMRRDHMQKASGLKDHRGQAVKPKGVNVLGNFDIDVFAS